MTKVATLENAILSALALALCGVGIALAGAGAVLNRAANWLLRARR